MICGLALCLGLLACKKETVEQEAQTLMVLNPTIEKVQGQEQQGEDNTFSDGVTWSIGMIIDNVVCVTYPYTQGQKILYWEDVTKKAPDTRYIKMVAVYPAMQQLSYPNILFDTRTTLTPVLLFAKALEVTKPDCKNIHLKFTHALSRVSFRLNSSVYSTDDLKKANLAILCHPVANVNLSNGDVVPGVELDTLPISQTTHAISMVPQDVSEITLSITIDATKYNISFADLVKKKYPDLKVLSRPLNYI